MAIHRYETTPRDRSEIGKRTLKTQIPAFIEKDVRDIYIYTRVGDRLDLLASQYYGDRTKWVYLAAANKLTELIVEPGIQLRIPYSDFEVEKKWIEQNKNR